MKKLHFGDRWQLREPVCKKGGMVIAWSNWIYMKQIWMDDFCTEMRLVCDGENEEIWLIFVYCSTEAKERHAQWDFLKARKQGWGKYLVMGGDFNDIRSQKEKQGGKRNKRAVSSLLESALQI